MGWIEKERATPFDTAPIEGLTFLDGNMLAAKYQQEHVRGQKYPAISFPSELVRELADSSHEGGVVHIFSGLELKHKQSRDDAFEAAQTFAAEYDYTISKAGESGLRITNPDSGLGYEVVYDTESNQITDIRRFPEYAMELLDGLSRAALPKLYSGEKKGLDAIAPVKFFTPDAQWVWYASEYDGEDMFFGLVSGLEVELGYFSLAELEGIRGPLGLPIERDLYFKPTSLRKLNTHHS